MTQEILGPGGDLDPELRRALDQRLGCDGHDDEAVLARVKARVLQSIASERIAPQTVRAEEGRWHKVGPGVECKLLWRGPTTESMMLRLAPGAVVAAHMHASDEECVVLEGSVRFGGLVLHSGDFHVGPRGSVHEISTTETGALLYIRGARREPLPG